MKKLTFLFLLLTTCFSLFAQLRLEVEGDAKIAGRLDLNTGNQNVFIGMDAGINTDLTSNGENVFIGFEAGKSNTTGDDNTFIGKQAGLANTRGENNTFIGMQAGLANTRGENNTFIGMKVGLANTIGEDNTFIGRDAGETNTTGNNNIFIGRDAGGTNIEGNRNTLLGNSADVTMNSLDRAMALGHNAQVNCDNCAVIGGTGDDAVKVGIGTTTPMADLYIKQSSGTFSKPGTGGIILQDSSNADYKWQIGAVSQTLAFVYNGALKSYIDVTGHYNVLNPFTSPQDGGDSRNSDIQSMPNVLDKVKRLKPKTKQVQNGRNLQKVWGFAAEEVAPLFPEITPEVDGQRGVIYDYFGILSIKAIQELAATVESQEKDLKEENERQNQQIAAQNKTITQLTDKAVNQQTQIDELKSLVEKLITQNAEIPKSTSYVLPLAQKSFLAQNQPNPFRENTLVDYFIPATVKNAHLQVTALDGKVIGKVAIMKMGKGQVTIQSKSYAAGTYFYSLVLDGQVLETKRMVLAR